VQDVVVGLGFQAPTPPQALGIPAVLAGDDILLVAPTGSGKTEAALLPVLDALARDPPDGIGALYITPLRALNRDMERRLVDLCTRLDLRVEIRHGDTPTKQRRRQASKPPHILVTTPETLQAILPGTRMRRHLRAVRFVVVDEVHQLARDRRGVQLAVGLERLREAAAGEFQRILLSATVGQPAALAALFGGGKDVRVLAATAYKATEYRVEWPRPNDHDFEVARELYLSPDVAAAMTLMVDEIEAHRATLVFVNARTVAELLGSRFRMLSREVAVHHGSLPREERERVEASFKAGDLRALVCTSTLELGIDVGSVDLALQYMSPRQVTSLIQRVGRSGHALDRVSKGLLIAVSADDVLESLACIRAAREGALEPLRVHRGALDVLAHQLVGALLDRGTDASEGDLFELVRRADPYADLPFEAFQRVLAFLGELRLVRRGDGSLRATGKARRYYYENLSTIRDERRYPVVDLTTQRPVGILGEEFMLLRAREGVHFIVRGKPWRIQRIGGDGVVYVTPVPDPLAAIPGWDGEMLPVPFDLAQRVGRMRGDLADLVGREGQDGAREAWQEEWPLNPSAVRRLVEEVDAHLATGAPMPTDRRILVEAFDRFLVLHASFGEVVNTTLGDLLEDALAKDHLVRFWWADPYRILFELTVDTRDLDVEALVDPLLRLDEDALAEGLQRLLEEHVPLGYYMKFIAERFGALPRGLMMGEGEMNSIELRFRDTPIREEALREARLLHVDIEGIRRVYTDLRAGRIAVAYHRSPDTPTPLAYRILRRYVEAPELFSPEAEREAIIERMRLHVETSRVQLLCFACGAFHEDRPIGSLPERLACDDCGSPLLIPLNWSGWPVRDALNKRRRKGDLEEDEEQLLVRAKQGADLVAVYGRRAAMALAVYGVGPQTASRILARMHEDDKVFFDDLFEAKLRFITTRPYWDRSGRGGRAGTVRPSRY
jgi:ATP-dependent Lhr-like helicase